ncbi:hypothetical protein WMF04_44080 [Sorangium sp. So ce260]|uniref:hypothetical protein n=1 Tax=Sorangium sp. So ce260 TaxID=3133291 RepID=UPI003F5FAE13
MTGMLREVVRLGCAAAVVFTAAQAGAVPPAAGTAPLVAHTPPAPPSGPAGAPPAPAQGGAASLPLPPAPPAGDGSAPPAGDGSAPPAGDGGAPPAGAAPPGHPPPPPGWPAPPPGWPASPDLWQPGSAPAHEQPRPTRAWYGWQHLLVLGGTVLLAPIAVATENEPLAWLTAGAFALGGPVTHWANGHLGKGFASFGLNAGCTLGGGMVGALVGSSADSGRWDALAGLFIGGGLGLITANIIDIAVLEHEVPATSESYDYIRLRSPPLRLAPHVGLAPDRATIGLGGAF